jgi:hypothetical protein
MEAVIVFLKPRDATDAVGLGIQATGVCARNSTRAAAERVLVVRAVFLVVLKKGEKCTAVRFGFI